MKQRLCPGAEDTEHMGECLGRAIDSPAIDTPVSISLTGELGCGKTTFVRGLARGLGLGAQTHITSPTYTLINEYPADRFRLCHLDLYRLGSVEELAYIGFDDLLEENSVVVVEWPALLSEDGFSFDLDITFELDGRFQRILSVFPSGQAGANVLTKWFSLI